MKYLRFVLSIGFIITLVSQIKAQGRAFKWNEQRGNWYVGCNTATTRYCGDLSDRYALGHLQLGWAFEMHVRYRMTEQLSIRSEIGVYHLRGDQQYTINKDNHLSFSTTNPTFLAGLQWDLLPTDSPDIYDIPYVWAGFGCTYLKPTTTFQAIEYDLAPLHTENVLYARFVGQFTYAAGVPLRISRSVQLRLEGRYSHIFSDYVDDVSGLYVSKKGCSELERLLTDRRAEYGLTINEVGEKRGNSLRNDGYFAVIAQLSIKLKAH